MKNPRQESREAGSLGNDVTRADDLPSERESEGLGDEEAIRARAYELYLQRGDGSGDDMNDWLQAEREQRARRGRSEGGARDQPGL